MSGRDDRRGGGRSFGGDRRGGFGDRDGGRGGFGGGGNFRDRERGGRDFGSSPRPWERRDDDRPARPAGDRPFDRPAGPPQERDVRVERYDEDAPRPPRPERGFGDRPERGFGDRPPRPGDRPARFGGDRDAGPPPGGRFGRDTTPGPHSEMPVGRGEPRPTAPPAPAATAPAPKGAAAAAARPTPEGWTEAHLLDSWREEGRLKGWTPPDTEQREMVEDNIEADPQVPGRDRRAITVTARSGVVTLSGTVRSRAVKFAVGSDAYWTYGVNEVRNELLVKPRGPQPAGSAQPAAASAPTATPAAIAPAPALESPATAAIEPAGATPEPAEEATATPTPEELVAEAEAAPAASEAAPDVVEAAPEKPKRASRRKASVAPVEDEADADE